MMITDDVMMTEDVTEEQPRSRFACPSCQQKLQEGSQPDFHPSQSQHSQHSRCNRHSRCSRHHIRNSSQWCVPWHRKSLSQMLSMCMMLSLLGGTHATVLGQFSGGSQSSITIQHLSLSNSGELYVGATNNLYKLNDQLGVLEEVQTGPKLDNDECYNAHADPNSNTCDSSTGSQTKVNTDNVNKVLLVDQSEDKLIVCGSIYQGFCYRVPLSSLGTAVSPPDEIEMVAANTEDASTVGILAPGPPNPILDHVLYIGTTMSGHSQLRGGEVPAVSSRKVTGQNVFQYVADDTDNGGLATFLKYREQDCRQNEDFKVTYVDAFSADGYTYFLIRQRSEMCSSATSPYLSKIAQVCQSDLTYTSYMEMPLTCGDYNLIQDVTLVEATPTLAAMMSTSTGSKILVAVFTRSTSGTDTSTSHSAVCMYKLEEIRSKMSSNINACYTGTGSLAPHFYTEDSDLNCLNTATNGFSPPAHFCGQEIGDINLAIYANSASSGPSSQPLLTSNSSQFTSVITHHINSYTVLFIGTAQGRLKKVFFYPPKDHQSYETVHLSDNGAPVLQDMVISSDERNLYVPTTNKVYRVSVANCGQYTSCTTCREAMDPHCGWCTLERKCSWRAECRGRASALRWLSMSEQMCTAITGVSPPNMDISNTGTIDISISRLPTAASETYTCMQGNREIVATVVSSTVVRCDAPTSLPTIPARQDHVNLTLGVKSRDTGVVFAEVPYTFYSCQTHDDCRSCVETQFGCRWCTYSNRCTYAASACNTNMPAVSSFDWCPQLSHPVEPKILIPAGVPTSFTLQARNLPNPLSDQGGYECLLELATPALRVPAIRRDGSSVECEAFEYELPSSFNGERATDVQVVWNNDFFIFQQVTTLVYVYDCASMVEDCGQCLNVQAESPEYSCSWCDGSCQFQPTCNEEPATSCPNPVLEHVFPITGPLEGGTRVTITGSNLGSSYAKVRDSVTIADRPCLVDPDAYVTSRTIVCTTESVTMATTGLVVLEIDDVSVSYFQFTYQDPIVESLFPVQGPQDGGTEITITGQHVNTGSHIVVSLDNRPCINTRIGSPTKLHCTTSAVSYPTRTTRVTVNFDRAQRYMDASFDYTENPTITSIQPNSAFIGGGRMLSVVGTSLDVVQHPRVFLTQDGWRSEPENCTVHNGTQMLCPSPSIPDTFVSSLRRRRDLSQRNNMELGFIMDGVASVQNLSVHYPDVVSSFDVVRNPVYFDFEFGLETYNTDGFFVIAGQDLNLACETDEISVLIGAEPCEVDSLSPNKLLCLPPKTQPPGVNNRGDPSIHHNPEVKITVGKLVFRPGQVEYAARGVSGPLPIYVIAAIAAGGGLFIVIIMSILIISYRKSKEAQQKIKKMLIQLDMLESNVRNECKQAFAELQTEVTDLTSDLTMTGIPFWDYQAYSFKVLFPSHTDHPVLHVPHSEYNELKVGYEQGLQQFNQLLSSKQFLVIFIRTLEQQKNFSIRDRAVVASLLMVVLQDKMEYATDILKALLNELIDRSVEKKNPKLLFRRTESVVEKFLTNWLSLCMYDYLKKHAGRHLFILFKAIKHQTEKGPVDAISGEARYSLSEDRLLREKIEPHTLNVNLLVENGSEPVVCKMLDCDTITQAKEKALDSIYMNTPFSRRPSVYDVDLDWRSGRSGHLPLQDEDVTTEMVKGWKRVNTLAHYHIPDGAIMALIPKRFKNDYVRQVHGMVEITSGSSLTNLTPIITVEEGTKVWHMVKHDDNHHQSRAQKVISEIFLTRLLTTKGTLQQYIDDLFLSILKTDNQCPTAIKFLFDFLDQAARRHNIVDPDVVHTWKSNSLPLRFWVNILKNPEFVFDIHKSHITDSCLSVIAQTFMDACSTSEHRLGKDSPTNKLLFAKDIPKYRKWVERYYKDVAEMAPVSDQDMNTAMTELSMHNVVDFNIGSALKELFKYATHYNYELLEALDTDHSAKKLHLAHKFDQINSAIDGTIY